MSDYQFVDQGLAELALGLLGPRGGTIEVTARDRSAFRAMRTRIGRTSLLDAVLQAERGPSGDDEPTRSRTQRRREAVRQLVLNELPSSGAQPTELAEATELAETISTVDAVTYLRASDRLQRVLRLAEQLAEVHLRAPAPRPSPGGERAQPDADSGPQAGAEESTTIGGVSHGP